MVVHVLEEGNIITYTFPVLIPFTNKTSSTLYQDVMNFFVGNNIPYKQNMVGFTVEEADCVLRTNHSLFTYIGTSSDKMDESFDYIMNILCACLKLPSRIETLQEMCVVIFSIALLGNFVLLPVATLEYLKGNMNIA